MPTPCSIVVMSDDPGPVPVTGVVVQVYTANTTTLVTSGTTDGAGRAAFSLPDAPYDVRFYKQGVSILPKQPQRVIIDSTSLVGNTFTVTGHVTSLPESIDPLRCRISGYILGPDGAPLKEMKLSFVPLLDLNIFSGNVVAPQLPLHLSSDDSGHFDFTLLRGTTYKGYMTGVDVFLNVCPAELDIRVPNLPAIALDGLLFPLPLSATFSVPTLTLSLVGPPDTSVLLTVNYSDGSQRTKTPPWVSLQRLHTDDTIVEATLQDGVLALVPRKAGVDTLTVSRLISSLARWNPAPTFTSGSLIVTVA